MLKINAGSHKYKNMDTNYNMMLVIICFYILFVNLM
jgi:hypothetical protein